MRREKGFTLIEILVVAGIIGLIAAIGIPNLLRARVTANESSAQATLKSISTALETYSIANGSYPPNTTVLMTSNPPYLNKDYFTGVQSGYVYAATIASYSYSITATPETSNSGRVTYTMSTGSVMMSSP
jgi:type IV pilus assembly protein PilA